MEAGHRFVGDHENLAAGEVRRIQIGTADEVRPDVDRIGAVAELHHERLHEPRFYRPGAGRAPREGGGRGRAAGRLEGG